MRCRMVNLYSLVLFVHGTADIFIFVGPGAQPSCFMALRRAETVEQVVALLPHMAHTVWDLRQGWISVALGGLILFLPC